MNFYITRSSRQWTMKCIFIIAGELHHLFWKCKNWWMWSKISLYFSLVRNKAWFIWCERVSFEFIILVCMCGDLLHFKSCILWVLSMICKSQLQHVEIAIYFCWCLSKRWMAESNKQKKPPTKQNYSTTEIFRVSMFSLSFKENSILD